MEILKYYTLSKQEKEYWNKLMDETDWDAGKYLAWLLREDKFYEACGNNSEALLLVENDKLAAFCTYAEFDEIESENMKPWIGFVYTFPNFRGHRCSGTLVEYAVELARNDGFKSIYVSSEETGLYEKYGFEFVEWRTSIHGYETKVFKREFVSEA